MRGEGRRKEDENYLQMIRLSYTTDQCETIEKENSLKDQITVRK